METEQTSHLTSKDILEKDFKSGFKGYDKDDVDQFLDMVIKDYEIFQKESDYLNQENKRLKRELEKMHEQQKKQPAADGNTNYDILKRLSHLEKEVFGNKLMDE